ncbi:MAG: TetR/AcrR family transcriptional regulator [Amylibacter sp.]
MARPIAKDYGTKRRLILDQAARLFANEGFDRTSVSRIAQSCKISKANVYHYYGSKDEILFDILDAYLSGLRDRIIGMKFSDQSAQKRFSLTITEILLAYQGADFEHRLQANVMGHLPPDQQAVLQGYQKDLVTHLSILVSDIAPQVFADDKPKLRAATMSVFGMLNWFYMWNPNADEKARKDYGELISKLCLNGLPNV